MIFSESNLKIDGATVKSAVSVETKLYLEGLLVVTVSNLTTGSSKTVTVCSEGFGLETADVLCRYFGFNSGIWSNLTGYSVNFGYGIEVQTLTNSVDLF